MGYLKNLFNLGLNHVYSYDEIHRVRYVNKMLIVGLIGSTFFTFLNLYLGLTISYYGCVFLIAVFAFCFYLNAKGLNNLSPIFAIISTSLITMLTAWVNQSDVGLHYLLFPVLGLTAFTISSQKKSLIFMTMLFVLGSAFSIIFFEFDQQGIYPLNHSDAKILHTSVFLVTGLIFIFKIFINLDEMDKRFNSYIENQSKLEGQTRMSDLGRLMAGIAHEINNPLAVIKGSASFCLKRMNRGEVIKSERLKQELERISHQVGRVVKIIEGLRFVSRDGTKDPMEPHSINKTIKEAYELCCFKLKEKNVISELVPLYSDDTMCAIKLVQIEQVIFSLVSNAIDALSEQEDKRVSIIMSENNESVFIRISDNGPGIPAELRSEVVKPFFTTKPVGEGTGLGLSVAFEIIQKHKGLLKIEDSLDGASFLIKLPKAETSLASSDQAA